MTDTLTCPNCSYENIVVSCGFCIQCGFDTSEKPKSTENPVFGYGSVSNSFTSMNSDQGQQSAAAVMEPPATPKMTIDDVIEALVFSHETKCTVSVALRGNLHLCL